MQKNNIKDRYGLGSGTIGRFGFELSLKVYDRAKRKCQLCGEENDLTIHHIDRKGRNYENKGLIPNNSLENLVVLCRSCHGRIHGKQGKGVKKKKSWIKKNNKLFKICPNCKISLEANKENFYFRKTGIIIGLCKKCSALKNKENATRDKEKIRKYWKKYNAKKENKDRTKELYNKKMEYFKNNPKEHEEFKRKNREKRRFRNDNLKKMQKGE